MPERLPRGVGAAGAAPPLTAMPGTGELGSRRLCPASRRSFPRVPGDRDGRDLGAGVAAAPWSARGRLAGGCSQPCFRPRCLSVPFCGVAVGLMSVLA